MRLEEEKGQRKRGGKQRHCFYCSRVQGG